MWFDSHCHLHLCEGPIDEVLGRARAGGVAEFLTVGIDVGSSRTATELTMNNGVWAACGVHPNDCADFDDEDASALEELLGHDRVVAVGESGLDFYRDEVEPPIQRRVFDVHIELAKNCDKTLVIHTRESVREAIEVLKSAGPPNRLVFHCWSGGPRDLERALDLGAFISFAGNVSFKSAKNLREVAKSVPHERLLVETDSPFLSPEPHRGKPNEPARVALVGNALSAALGLAGDRLASLTSGNAKRLFGLP